MSEVADESGAAGRLHPFTLLFSTVDVARRLVVPALVGGLSAGGGDLGSFLTWAFLGLTVPAIAFAVAKYLLFRYRLSGSELVIDSGVLNRRHRVLPLERVQNIDVRQTFAQRIFGVAELRVETASGGDESEARLSVLDKQTAEDLRAELARRRGGAGPRGREPAEQPAPTVLARLSRGDLALAGATANKAGLLAAVLGGAFQFLDQVPIEALPPSLAIEPEALAMRLSLPPVAFFVLGILAAAVVFLVIGWVVSIAGSMIAHHGLVLERRGQELHERYGLFSRREGTVPLRRVQAIRVEESLLRRPLGLAALRIETAGAAPGQKQEGGAEAFVPLARAGEVPGFIASIFEDVDYGALQFWPVHPRARRRIFFRWATPIALAAAALAIIFDPAALWGLLLLAPAWLLADREYRNRGYALAPGYAVARAGWWNRVTWIIPDHRIQTLHTRETPFQRRQRLATLYIDTAAGAREGAAVVDLGREDARGLLGELAGRSVRRRRPPSRKTRSPPPRPPTGCGG